MEWEPLDNTLGHGDDDDEDSRTTLHRREKRRRCTKKKLVCISVATALCVLFVLLAIGLVFVLVPVDGLTITHLPTVQLPQVCAALSQCTSLSCCCF